MRRPTHLENVIAQELAPKKATVPAKPQSKTLNDAVKETQKAAGQKPVGVLPPKKQEQQKAKTFKDFQAKLPKEHQKLYESAVYMSRSKNGVRIGDVGNVGDQKEFKIDPKEAQRIYDLLKTKKGLEQVQREVAEFKANREGAGQRTRQNRAAGKPDYDPSGYGEPVRPLTPKEEAQVEATSRQMAYDKTTAGKMQKGIEETAQKFAKTPVGQGLERFADFAIDNSAIGSVLPEDARKGAAKSAAELPVRAAFSPAEAATNLFGLIDPETPKGDYRLRNAVGLAASLVGVEALSPVGSAAKTAAKAAFESLGQSIAKGDNVFLQQAASKVGSAVENVVFSRVVRDANRQFKALGKEGEQEAKKFVGQLEAKLVSNGVAKKDAQKQAHAVGGVIGNALSKGQDPAEALRKFGGFVDEYEQIGPAGAVVPETPVPKVDYNVKGAFDPNTFNAYLGKNADFSTVVHELGGHFVFNVLPPDTQKRVLSLVGAESLDNMAQEQFARLFEDYISTGIAPTKSLQTIMGAMKGWMKEVYGSASVLDSPLTTGGKTLRSEGLTAVNPEIRAFFDELVVSPAELEAWKALKRTMYRASTVAQPSAIAPETPQVAAQIEEVRKPDDLKVNYVGASEVETGTGARNADMDAYRREYGLPEITRQPRHVQEVFDSAIQKGLVSRAEGIADRVIKEGAGAFTAEEQAAVALAIGKRRGEAEEALKAASKFAPDDASEAAIMARSIFSEAEDALEKLSRANRMGGSEWGLSGRIRQIINDFKNDPITLKDRVRIRLGRELTQAERSDIERLQAELLDAKSRITELEANASKVRAGQAVKNLRQNPRSVTRTVSTEKYQQIIARYQQDSDKLNQLSSDEWNDLSIVTRYHLEEAVEAGKELDQIVTEIKRVMPSVDEADIINAVDAEARSMGRRIFRGRVLGEDMMASGSAAIQVRDVAEARRQLEKILGELDKMREAPGIDIAGLRLQVQSLSEQMKQAVEARDFNRVLELQDEMRSLGRTISSGKTYAEDFMKRGQAGYQDPEIRALRGVNAKMQNSADRFIKWAEQESIKANSTKFQNIARAAYRGMLEFRNLKASLDVSAAGRQGFILSMLNPKSVPKDFWRMLESGFSEKKYWEVMGDIEAHPMYDKSQMGKVEFSGFDSLTPDEEQAMATIGKGLKGFGRGVYDKTIGASNRMYSAYLNLIRMDAFENLVNAFEYKHAREATIDELEAIGNWVNVASGRGKLSENVKVGTIEQALFFAPRYNISRIQLLAGQPIITAAKASPEVSRLIAQQYMKAAAGFVSIAMLMKASGADIEMDARSSDFGQGRWGNMRVDFSAGLRSYATLAARMMPKTWVDAWNQTLKGDMEAAGESLRSGDLEGSVKTTRGMVNEQDRIKTLGRFAEGKAAPLPSVLYQVGKGKDFTGEPMTPGKALSGLVEPIISEQTREDLSKHPDDPAGNAVRFGLNLVGVGSSYQDAKPGDPYSDPTPEIQLLIDFGLDARPPELSAQRQGESDRAYARRGELFKKNFERTAQRKREALIRAVRRVMPMVEREKDPEKKKAILKRARDAAVR